MKLFYIVLCTTALIFGVICVDINKCSAKNLQDVPKSIHFESIGCDKLPCPLVRQTTSDANITFRVPYDVGTSKVKIDAKVEGTFFWTPFLPDDTNTCHMLLNSYCPLDENEEVTYHLGIYISKLYPKVSLILRIQFLDEEGSPMMCIEVPCKVVDKQENVLSQ